MGPENVFKVKLDVKFVSQKNPIFLKSSFSKISSFYNHLSQNMLSLSAIVFFAGLVRMLNVRIVA